jgi:hypothetical protein
MQSSAAWLVTTPNTVNQNHLTIEGYVYAKLLEPFISSKGGLRQVVLMSVCVGLRK